MTSRFRLVLPYPILVRPCSVLCVVLVSALGILACDESSPTETRGGATRAAATDTAGQATSLVTDNVSALAIGLPVNQNVATAAPNPAFKIVQTGTGPNGVFQINNAGSSSNALQGQTNGSGIAVRGVAASANSRPGAFEITNASNPNDALTVNTNGSGVAVNARASGNGTAGVFSNTSSKPALVTVSTGSGLALQARALGSGPAAKFDIPGTTNSQAALDVSTRGSGSVAVFHRDAGSAQGPVVFAVNGVAGAAVGHFQITSNISQAPVLILNTPGPGWAGDFQGTTKGVRITTNAGGAGLQVVNGTKNAVVNTASGARDLYTEESSEVWFTDYGFGRLDHGRARILIDPTFAQTISPEVPYHVFVEAYGPADLYVAERTPLGFVVQAIRGDSTAEFSYRLVAKRRGYEVSRLERAPWADNDAAR
jgi:hypothetical protein